MNEPRKDLLALGLSESEATVYLAMTNGARTAHDIIKTTRIKRPTVYYTLGCLEKRGLLGKTGAAGDKRLSLASPERLGAIAEEKMLEAKQLTASINDLVANFKKNQSPASQKPAVSFYEGVEAVKSVIMDTLYCKDKQVSTVAPKDNFFWQVGGEFVKMFVEERVRREIQTKNLWDGEIDKKVFKRYYDGVSDVRIVPQVMRGHFKSTVFLYDDKTLYVSSMKDCYCILITSQEHHDTMQAWFDGLWSASKPHAA
jgi:sugar-specific transcriptional regulator TrmB